MNILLGLFGVPIVIGALSSWMRFNEYHLPGHTRKEASNVLTAEDCWDACLQETSFSCLSVAYAGVSKSCKLYDKQALSVYKDGAHSDEFNYYEYCADGTSTWTVYRDTAILGHNIDANTLYGIHDVQRCLDACEANPACGAVDYTPLSGACYMNYVTGMDTPVANWDTVSANGDHLYTRCKQVTYNYGFRRMSSSMKQSSIWYTHGILDTYGNTKTSIVEVPYRNQCPLLCLVESRCLGYRLNHTTDVGAALCEFTLAD